MDPFIGQVIMFAGNFAPRGWAFCNGQLLPIAQYSALFSILGTTYGGDGRTTFALPDLRGRAPVHAGTGPGLTNRNLGSKGGAETVTLTEAQMPQHDHRAFAVKAKADGRLPAGKMLARPDDNLFADPSNDRAKLADRTIGDTGGGQAHDNMPPFLALNYIIALQGTFPSRS